MLVKDFLLSTESGSCKTSWSLDVLLGFEVVFHFFSITDEMILRRGSLDLAVAHMVCALGGRVQFVGGPPNHWHLSYNKAPPDLPASFSGDLKLEAIDFSGTAVMYEGLTRLRKF